MIFICFILLPASKSPAKLAPDTIDSIKQRYEQLQQQLQQKELQLQQQLQQGQGQHKLIDINGLKLKSLFGQQQQVSGGDENGNQQQGQQQPQTPQKKSKVAKKVAMMSPMTKAMTEWGSKRPEKLAAFKVAIDGIVNGPRYDGKKQSADELLNFQSTLIGKFDNSCKDQKILGELFKKLFENHYEPNGKDMIYFYQDIVDYQLYPEDFVKQCFLFAEMGANKMAAEMYVTLSIFFYIFVL